MVLDPAKTQRVINSHLAPTQIAISDSGRTLATLMAQPPLVIQGNPDNEDISKFIRDNPVEKVQPPSVSGAQYLIGANIFSEREILLKKREEPMAPEYPNNNNDKAKNDQAKGPQ